MSDDHVAKNEPLKEFKYSLVMVVLFAVLVGAIVVSGILRPAAPKTLAETQSIIAETPAAVK